MDSLRGRVILHVRVPLDRAVELYAVRSGADVRVLLVCERQRETEAIAQALLAATEAPP